MRKTIHLGDYPKFPNRLGTNLRVLKDSYEIKSLKTRGLINGYNTKSD